jgi:uncharacterized protein
MSTALDLAVSPITEVQGPGLFSPVAGQRVRVRGVVTGRSRQGFYVQAQDEPTADASGSANVGSAAIFVVAQAEQIAGQRIAGALVELYGTVLDFVRDENDRPSTQLLLEQLEVLAHDVEEPAVVWLTAENLPSDSASLAAFLNQHEFMRVGLRAGGIFSAPSNPFGDYVVLPKNMDAPRSRYGSAILDKNNPERWYPGFRITRLDQAPVVNVGDRLGCDVTGPLNYRVGSYQIAVQHRVSVIARDLKLAGLGEKTLASALPADYTSILTLNAFNLDQQVENPHLVEDPRMDVDDDVGDRRFSALARVIVQQARSPAIVALQEIQDNDGAEITEVSEADKTYQLLIDEVLLLGGPRYHWADIAPIAGADGGQPGGNIRNGYLFDPARACIDRSTMQRLGQDDAAFEGSRKALYAEFDIVHSGGRLAVINLHLASKRHQNSIFSPQQPGFDAREAQRIAQAQLIRTTLVTLNANGQNYYVTGDFNDFEFSPTVHALLGQESSNLVNLIEPQDRFDYNHRGKLHTLMQAIVSNRQFATGECQFEILHGNELLGIPPGSKGARATDHAYVIAHLRC